MTPLDRPVWSALATLNAPFGRGGDLARRYQPAVNVFGAVVDDSAAAHAAIADLVAPGERIVFAQVPAVVVPAGFRTVLAAMGVQMVATRDLRPETEESGLDVLTDDDAPAMLALAKLTEPGPFAEQTHRMGRFLGVRDGGALAAMAGERMRLPGFTEVSAVCTHPAHRGRGLAGRLSAAVAAHIQARGAVPFLHAWATNHAAIRLYQRLGFVIRADIHITVLERDRTSAEPGGRQSV